MRKEKSRQRERILKQLANEIAIENNQQSAAITTIQYDEDDLNSIRGRDRMSGFSCFEDDSNLLDEDGRIEEANQLNLHGRSQSSFRSYTNHHMGSGSNHCISADNDELEEEIDCDTCFDRQ